MIISRVFSEHETGKQLNVPATGIKILVEGQRLALFSSGRTGSWMGEQT